MISAEDREFRTNIVSFAHCNLYKEALNYFYFVKQKSWLYLYA